MVLDWHDLGDLELTFLIAENHYTADYPEDEVDSDDDVNRGVYRFRDGYGSDNEEFDLARDSDADQDDYVLDDHSPGDFGDYDLRRFQRLKLPGR